MNPRMITRCMDNIEMIGSLPDNFIDLIYCDVLYGTGKKLKDYQDLKPIRSEIEIHYIPRVKEMWRVLKDTGSIYLQMDTRINHWLRCIMDDVFGQNNFRNEIIWNTGSNISGFKSLKKKGYVRQHDVVLFYTKSNNFMFNIQTFDDKVRRYKQCITEKEGKICGDTWNDILSYYFSHIRITEKRQYDTQKPKALLERIIKASSNEGDWIADFYMGSETTAVVAKELNRNFIGCDINPRAIEITKRRLKLAAPKTVE